VSMTGTIDRVEVITSVQRRRRWSAEENATIVQETYAPGMSVSLVAPRHGIARNQLFRWRRLYAEGALSAVGPTGQAPWAEGPRRGGGAGLRIPGRELQRLLGKKTLQNEVLREALDLVQPKKRLLRSPRPLATTRYEDDRRCPPGGALKPGSPGDCSSTTR
jgi:transposase